MPPIETRILRLEQRLPDPDPLEELDHRELKALRAIVKEEISAREQSRKPAQEVQAALGAMGRDWHEWFGRVITFMKLKPEGAK
jgi:hypothetical protein